MEGDQDEEDRDRGRRRQHPIPGAGGHPDGRVHPDRRGRRESVDARAGAQNGPRPEKADARDDLRSNPRRVGVGAASGELERDDREEGRTQRDERVGSEACSFLPNLPLGADERAEEPREQQASDELGKMRIRTQAPFLDRFCAGRISDRPARADGSILSPSAASGRASRLRPLRRIGRGGRMISCGQTDAMEVYLVPLGGERYELYCEVQEDAGLDAAAPSRGVRQRVLRAFRHVLALAERDRRRTERRPAERTAAGTRGWLRRLRDRSLRWVAEAIAAQRLLWHLRRQHQAVLVYPADLDEGRARGLLAAALARDRRRHTVWLIVDGGLLVLSGLVALVPGPNLLAYYFAFRCVGHYLARRGAHQGLTRVRWQAVPNGSLAELRSALTLAPAERRAQLRVLAARLKLRRLVTFVERAAVSTATPG